MPEVLVALFDSYAAADAARTELVAAGFPTDRVELTSRLDEGRAGAVPGERFTERATQYFNSLFEASDSERYAGFFTEGLQRGGATIAVHPRGQDEIERATDILRGRHPIEIEGSDLGVRGGVCVAQARSEAHRTAARNTGTVHRATQGTPGTPRE